MWWTEIAGLDKAVGLLGVVDIRFQPVLESTEMMKRMIAYLMASLDDPSVQIGILAHIVAHHEERGLGPISLKSVEDERRSLGDGTVIEGQIY